MNKIPLLTSEDIECKVKQVTKTGALLLLYKTSRTDAKILDEVFGPLNWTVEYKEIKGNLYCGIGIREDASQNFVYKWDCGIESGQDDGNEKKAESSDAFKRAASRLGVGRELYTSPQIWANVATVQKGDKYYLSDPYAKYIVTRIEYNEDTRVITGLDICNAKSGVKVFSWDMATTGAMSKKMVNTLGPSSEKAEKAPEQAVVEAKSKVVNDSAKAEKTPLKTLISEIGKMAKNLHSQNNMAAYNAIVKEVTGLETFKCSSATQDQYDLVLGIYDKLVAGGYNV